MPMKQSAGILAYRFVNECLEVFLVHPGGPFWSKKDLGSWSIPKGEFNDDEDPLIAAQREFEEEVGVKLTGDEIALKPVKLKSGKIVYAWAVKADIDVSKCVSNQFEIEWPPKSNKIISIPEIDRWEWFCIEYALKKVNPAQSAFILELIELTESDATY